MRRLGLFRENTTNNFHLLATIGEQLSQYKLDLRGSFSTSAAEINLSQIPLTDKTHSIFRVALCRKAMSRYARN